MTLTIDELIVYSKKCSVDETVVLQGLLGSSTKFKNFYEKERQSIQCEIIWVFNDYLDTKDQLPDGDLARVNWIDNSHAIIIFKHNPPLKADETIIAHELAHMIIKERGFPLVRLTDQDSPIPPNLQEQIFCLNNMIHDPLVISLLTSYGYDLRREYLDECKKGVRLSSSFREKPDPILFLNMAFNFVQTHLMIQILSLDKKSSCQKLQEIITSIYPELKREADVIIQRIDKIGYDTPEKVRAVYQEIIKEHLGLEMILTV